MFTLEIIVDSVLLTVTIKKRRGLVFFLTGTTKQYYFVFSVLLLNVVLTVRLVTNKTN